MSLGFTSLEWTTTNSECKCVEILITAGVDVNNQDLEGITVLIVSVREGHDACTALILQAGADVNSENARRYTALILAAQNGDGKCLQHLIRAGANVNSEGHMGLTPPPLFSKQKSRQMSGNAYNLLMLVMVIRRSHWHYIMLVLKVLIT